MEHQTIITVYRPSPCGCVRPNTCSLCRTPEEEDQYWIEKIEDLEGDGDDYQDEDFN